MRARNQLKGEKSALGTEKRKLAFVTAMFVVIAFLVFPVSSKAIECQQYDFGAAALQYRVYSDGRTWNFTADADMAVGAIEVESVLGSFGFMFHIQVKVNGTVLDSWDQSASGTHLAVVALDLHAGDTITYHIYGGTMSSAAGTISGPNYVKLCDEGSPEISISPTAFEALDVIASFDSPGSTPTGLAFDGTYLWNADYGDKIYKLDTSGNIIASFDSPGPAPYGLAFDGTYLWNADYTNARVYQLDTSGNIIASFDSPGSTPTGLAFDGTYLWNVDGRDGKIYQLDTSGNIISSFDFDCSGLTFDGTYLWASTASPDQKIYQLDRSGNIIDYFDSPGSWARGLAFDGTYLWNADNSDDEIFKLEVPLPVSIGSSKSQTFTVSNFGGDLAIDVLSITGTNPSEFSVKNDNCSNQTITPSGTCTFDVVFSPISEGEKSANLEITSNDPDTPTLSVPLSGTGILTDCLAVGADLSIQVPCAEYSGNQYGFTLNFYRNPDDPSGYYWKMVMSTLTTGTGSDCISIGTDLSMPMDCVSSNGTQYGFTLNFYNNPYDSSSYYWKMDMNTLVVK